MRARRTPGTYPSPGHYKETLAGFRAELHALAPLTDVGPALRAIDAADPHVERYAAGGDAVFAVLASNAVARAATETFHARQVLARPVAPAAASAARPEAPARKEAPARRRHDADDAFGREMQRVAERIEALFTAAEAS